MKRYPLLQSQMGVFAECIKNPDSAGYNLPPYDPLTGEDHATNRKIIHAFCPKMDYRNTFLQNVTILDWMVQE